MRYSKDLREKVMKYLESGHTIKETMEVYEVGRTTIREWRILRAETGSLAHRPHKRRSRKIDSDSLVTYINEHPDSYLIEIADVFNCTPQAVFYALKRLGIMRKKND